MQTINKTCKEENPKKQSARPVMPQLRNICTHTHSHTPTRSFSAKVKKYIAKKYRYNEKKKMSRKMPVIISKNEDVCPPVSMQKKQALTTL